MFKLSCSQGCNVVFGVTQLAQEGPFGNKSGFPQHLEQVIHLLLGLGATQTGGMHNLLAETARSPSALLAPFLGEGSPSKIDYRISSCDIPNSMRGSF